MKEILNLFPGGKFLQVGICDIWIICGTDIFVAIKEIIGRRLYGRALFSILSFYLASQFEN
jgi:hypothetical protein